MKTANHINRKMNTVLIGLTIITIIPIFFTSCQKEELQPSAAASNVTPMNDQNSLTKLTPELAFSSIKIDHIAALSQYPSYSITVNSNGTVVYEGRRNVYIKGTRIFEIKRSTLLYLNNVCMGINFFDLKGGINYIPDMPLVETTYTLLNRQKSLIDFEGEPTALVAFRTTIENALDLSEFINAPAGTAVAYEVE